MNALYLYLLFDEGNFAQSSEWIFTTEAHLVRIQERKHVYGSKKSQIGGSFDVGNRWLEEDSWKRLIKDNFSKKVQKSMNESATYQCRDTTDVYDKYGPSRMMKFINL